MNENKNPVFERSHQHIETDEILTAISKGSDIRLQRCIIAGDLDINLLLEKPHDFDTTSLTIEETDGSVTITLPQTLIFESCTFEENLIFAAPWAGADTVKVIFKRDLSFNSSRFRRETRFCSAAFHGSVGFDGCRFEQVASFRQATFKSSARFRTADFDGYCILTKTKFHSAALFGNTRFGKGANFSDVTFAGDVGFGGTHSDSKVVPLHNGIRFTKSAFGVDETFWRFIKGAAREAGHYQLAGESFYKERCSHLWYKFRGPNYTKLTKTGRFWRILAGIKLLPELIFGRLLFGYGERPVRVLLASLLIVLLCGGFYFQFGSILYRGEIIEKTFADCLYFSTITFTTLGFGDFHPGDHGLTRFVAMAEAAGGACLLALFVVGLAKRFSRS